MNVISYFIFAVVFFAVGYIAKCIYMSYFAGFTPQSGDNHSKLRSRYAFLRQKQHKTAGEIRELTRLAIRIKSLPKGDRWKRTFVPQFGFSPQEAISYSLRGNVVSTYDRTSSTLSNIYDGIESRTTSVFNDLGNHCYRKLFDPSSYSIRSATHSISDIELPKPFSHRRFFDFSVNNLERYLFLLASIQDSKSIQGIMAAVLQFLKTEFDKSLTVLTYDAISSFLSPMEPQSSENFTKNISLFRKDFKQFMGTKLFGYVKKCLSLVVGLGYCQALNQPFAIEGVEVFDGLIQPEKLNVLSAIDFFYELAEEMGRVFSSCFRSKSLRPFLFSCEETEVVETLYLDLIELSPYLNNGDLEAVKTTEEAYWTKLDTLNSKLLAMHAGANHPAEKLQLFNRLVTVRKWIAEFNTIQNSGALREAPFCFMFHGLSGVGKTTAANLFNLSILKANGFDCDPKKIVTHNESDKYFSNYRSDIVTIVLDDLANTKEDFLDESPLTSLLKFKNNNPEYAVMADLESKGKIAVKPKTLLITTNIPTLNAPTFSHAPLSMLRRVDMHIGVTVKPQFCTPGTHFLDQARVLDYVATKNGDEAMYSDIWDFSVLRAIPYDTDGVSPPGTVSYVNLLDNTPVTSIDDLPPDIKCTGIRGLIELGVTMSKKHFLNQKRTVKMANKLHECINICTKCTYPTICCQCVTEETLEKQSGEESTSRAGVLNSPQGVVLAKKIEYYTSMQNLWIYSVFGSFLLDYPQLRVICFLFHPKYWSEFIKSNIIAVFISFVAINLCRLPISIWLLVVLFIVYRDVERILDEYTIFSAWITRVPGTLMSLTERVRKSNMVWLFGGSAVTVTLISALRMAYNMYRTSVQSGLSPDSEEELATKLAAPNQWDRTTMTPIPCTMKAKTTTILNTVTKIQRNLVYVRYLDGQYTTFTNGLFVKSNMLLIPRHNVPSNVSQKGEFNLEIIRGLKTGPHWKFKVRCSLASSVDLETKDMMLVYVSNGGDWSDISEYFPLEEPRSSSFVMPYRVCEGGFVQFSGHTSVSKKVYNGYRTFSGATYTLDQPTFAGLCMAPLISDTKCNVILGFHLGGVTGAKRGCSGVITLPELEKCCEDLVTKLKLPIGTSAGTMPTEQYGKKVITGHQIHPKSPLNYFPPEIPIDVYGPCEGAASYYTTVKKFVISDLVETHCGSPNIYGGPKFGPETWKPWYMGMEGYSDIAEGPYPDTIQWALKDFAAPILAKFGDFETFRKLKPLDNEQVLNGIDGLRFVDRMARNKSVGFPLSGPISNYLLIDEDGEETVLDEIFWNEVARMEDCARRGERSYPIFKATLKDEVTKREKEKVRVFTAAALAHKLLIRKYFLPLTLVICADPTASECAVGINAYGPEWDDMVGYATDFGVDRMIAGDFKAYDQKLPPSITRAAFSVFLQMAELADYSSEEKFIMRHLVSDIVHATVAYNGTLVGFNGSQPSGQNLTVFINNFSNAILHRSAYYDSCPTKPNVPPYKENVKSLFYGDDSVGSVSESCNWFDNQVMSKQMDEYGMTYTPPDKAGSHPKFRPKGEVNFLKRDSRYDADIKHNVGALDIGSIFKSLHCTMSSPHVTDRELAAINIDNALRELFLHGREVYEHRRMQLICVATKAGILHMCRTLHFDFDDCLSKWNETYYPDYAKLPGNEPERFVISDSEKVVIGLKNHPIEPLV
jgi:hypothetical protein